MKEALKVVLLFLYAAAWGNSLSGLKWAAQGSLALAPSNPIGFTTDGATEESYKGFIEALRSSFAAGVAHGIPVLPDPSTLEERNRYVVVELSNSETESIQIGIDLTNAYVVAYRAGSESYFFFDAPDTASTYLFTDTNGHTLPFNGSYGALTSWGDRDREHTPLGRVPLITAIEALATNADDNTQRARALMVIVQMVSEAVRFSSISQRIALTFVEGQSPYEPSYAMGELENAWGSLSGNVQQSTEGTFPNPVILRNNRGEQVIVQSLSHWTVKLLALMLFACRPRGPNQLPPPLIIRSVVEPETCDFYEPTVRISGRDGMCLDVSDNDYHDGNPVVLSTCKDQLEDNQLWTLKSDKTIRSKGKCLTTYSADPEGKYVMIFGCESAAAREATQWEIWDNGTIINPHFGLALNSQSSSSGGTLTVEKNEYKMRQGWRTGNDTSAFVTAISGYKGLCMEAHGTNMWLDDCDTSKEDQQWAIYPDGSIRPVQNMNDCLTINGHFKEAQIVILSCSPGWASQRWVFKDDGTIYNLYDDMVMDVKNSDPSLKQIILYPWTGNDNQIWLPLF